MKYRTSAGRVTCVEGSLTAGSPLKERVGERRMVSLTPVSNAMNARTAHSCFAVPLIYSSDLEASRRFTNYITSYSVVLRGNVWNYSVLQG